MHRAILLSGLAFLMLGCGSPPAATGIPHVSGDDVIKPITGPADPYHNALAGPHGLNTGVTNYTDCTGRTHLTTAAAAIDTCLHDRIYVVGHNPGVFTPLLRFQPGDVMTFRNAAGLVDTWTVVGTRDWVYADGVPPLLDGARGQAQTCLDASGSVDRIVDFR
jgi:hypothetical protein